MDLLLQRAQELAEKQEPNYVPIEKRIAYVVSHGQSYASNGYAIRTQNIAKALNDQGLDTLCFVRPGRPWELAATSNINYEVNVDGVRYFHSDWLQKTPDNELEHLTLSVQRFVELFRVYRPGSVLAASNFIIGLPAWVAAKQLNIPFYNEVRGFWELSRAARETGFSATPAFYHETERDAFVARRAQKVFTLNQPMKAELVRRGVGSDKIELVPNGVSELLSAQPAKPELKKALGIEDGDKVIGYIGSFTAYEGLDTLVAACEQLVKQGERIILLLVGDDQPLTDTHKTATLKANHPWLLQVGRIPHQHIADYYALIDAVVIPRKKQAVCQLVPPMKVVEALGYAKRVLVSDVAALKEYAERYENVFSFEAENTNSLAESLKRCLQSPAPKSEVIAICQNAEVMAQILRKPAIEDDVCATENVGSSINSNPISLSESDVLIKESKDFTSYQFKNFGQKLLLSFVASSDSSYASQQLIFGIEFKDSDGDSVTSSSFAILNYKKSEKFSWYKYLSVSSDGTLFNFAFNVPVEATECVVRIGHRNGARIVVKGNLNVRFFNDDLSKVICEKINQIKQLETVEQVTQLLESGVVGVANTTDIVNSIASLPRTEFKAALVLWSLWRLTNDPDLFDMTNQRLVFQGRLYETKMLLDEFDLRCNFENGKHSARRVEDDINLLENGISLPSNAGFPAYKTSNNVLYLLHNRLPYNSGGYATRTHGLLTGIDKNSGYKMHGASRPGYPTDHVQHISKPLPKVIPRFDLIDGVEYYALEQNVRRSNMTTSEYIEYYAQQVEILAREKNARIIHAAANYPNGLAASLAARRLGIKSVYEVRGLWEITRLSRQEGWDETDQYRFMAKMEAEACNHADAVITITEALKDLMVARGVDPAKITVAPNCVHTDLFAPLDKDLQLAQELGINDDDIVIGYIGSIVNYEGLDDLLDALALLLKDGVTNFKFLLVGDGAVLDELKQQVISLGLQERVIITGRIPHEEVQRYYSLVDITPFPRKPYLVCETVSPLKPFEAMASQKAVLVSSCAALTEIIQDGYNGLVFEKGNVVSFKDQLKKLIVDGALRAKLSINGREWVIKERDWQTSSLKISRVYDQIS